LSEAELPSFEIDALHVLLEQEFNFLKKQDFQSFEELQHRKQELLNFLVNEISGESNPEIEITKKAISDNQDLSDRLVECQNMQKRNEILINQKLRSIQEVLSSLGHQNILTSKDTYEHLNKKTR
jgi:flagellar biosynthesis/type III secretory pathway chaperone|tara:strand:+ start:1090 stop:1464 length:375 start_codon:yes stop_codon:yes gene_type:complete